MTQRFLTRALCGAALAVCMTVGLHAQNALVYSGGAFDTTRESAAMDAALPGYTYDFTTSAAEAATWLDGSVPSPSGVPYDLIVWDQPNFLMTAAEASAVVNHVAGGGFAVFAYWDLDGSSGGVPAGVADAFGVTAATGMAGAPAVFPELGSTAHPIWDGPFGTFTSLTQLGLGYGNTGNNLEASTGTMIGTFDAAGIDPTQGAIIIANGGTTVINGWTHEAPDTADAVAILSNELIFATGATPPPPGPSDLICSTVSCPDGDVELSWTNPGGLDSIDVRRNGVVIATLAGGATSYTDAALAGGAYNYVVIGDIAGAATTSTSCSIGHCTNDECTTAYEVFEGVAEPFDTAIASTTGTAGCWFGLETDLWYFFEATADDTYRASTCAGGGDTSLAVYDSCGGVELACGDDDCGLSSEVEWAALSGEIYYIQVAGWGGGTVSSELLITPVVFGCAVTTPIEVFEGTPEAFDTSTSTTTGSGSCWFGTEADLWFTFVATADETYRASTCAGGGDTQIAVYDACGGLELGCGDDDCGLSSRADWAAIAGETYFIQVGGWNGATVFSELLVEQLIAPPNDNCVDRIEVFDATPEAFDTSTGALATGAGPACGAGSGSPDLWYEYTATCDGVAVISTCGSSYDTVLAVYDACGGVELACNDDSCGLQSQLVVPVVTGDVLIIEVAGFGSGSGPGTLDVNCEQPPLNDDCAGAIEVFEGTPEPVSTLLASITGTATCWFGIETDVWYSFEATSDVPYRASTCAGGGDTQIAVYDSCGGAELACGDDECGLSSEVIWAAIAGDTYFIQVAGWGGGTVTTELLVTDATPQPNLVYSGGAFDTTRESAAMDLVGLTGQFDFFTAAAGAATALAVSPRELVVWDQPNFLMDDIQAQALIDHIGLGGKAVFAYWDLDGSSSGFGLLGALQTAFGVTAVTGMTGAPTFYPEAGSAGHPIWDGPYGTFASMDQLALGYGNTGNNMSPDTGTMIGTFDPAGLDTAQAAIVVANADATVINGWTHEAPDFGEAVSILANEIEFVVGGVIVGDVFSRGDCNNDGGFDIGDPVSALSALFVVGTPAPGCLDACDANDDNGFDIGDPVSMLSSLFVVGSPPPAAPSFPDCGVDPTTPGLGCATQPTTACP